MDYAFQISASGILTGTYRMDVLANNLTNMNTAGYKPDVPILRARDVVNREDGLNLPSNEMLERLGGGVQNGRNRVNFSQGVLEPSDSPLDLGIQGQGFFVLRESGDSNGERVRLTRNGRFTLDGQGRLVSADSGLPVLSATGDTITLDPRRQVAISTEGVISQNGATVARLKLAMVPDTAQLTKVGNGMLSAPANALASRVEGAGIVRQGTVEQSVVDPLRAMMEISSAAREVESSVSVLQYTDRMLDRAINGLGRVA